MSTADCRQRRAGTEVDSSVNLGCHDTPASSTTVENYLLFDSNDDASLHQNNWRTRAASLHVAASFAGAASCSGQHRATSHHALPMLRAVSANLSRVVRVWHGVRGMPLRKQHSAGAQGSCSRAVGKEGGGA